MNIDSELNLSEANDVLPPYSALEQETGWLAVNPSYVGVLRVHYTIVGLFPTVILWILYAISKPPIETILAFFGIIIPMYFLAFVAFVVPRKVRRIQYLVRELDVNLRQGLLWYSSTSVATNRVQHIEVTQGPLERGFGLSTLSLFTAGGMRSDLRIPGLELKVAQQLKARLLQKISSEVLEDDEL